MNFRINGLLLVVLVILNTVKCFDPLSIGSGIALVGGIIYEKIKDNTLCRLKECCTKNEIPADFEKLQNTLEERVYGQHLVLNTVVNALKAHWDSPHAQKPLTLSFHGWPGGGKNYVSKFIIDSLYVKGSQSTHVHHFIGRLHFPLEDKTDEYKENLYNWVKGNVTRCPYQLFIFDEVDKMPPTILNGIKPVIDYREHLENVDYRKSIFIFLSNTGSTLINEHYMKFWRDGVRREDIKLSDFEKLIAQGAFNEQGGFHHSDTIRSNLIDHYIPFLPMQVEHIRLCILDEFARRKVSNPSEESIEEVMNHIDWDPQPEKILSRTGCKRLSQKVAMIVQMKYRK